MWLGRPCARDVRGSDKCREWGRGTQPACAGDSAHAVHHRPTGCPGSLAGDPVWLLPRVPVSGTELTSWHCSHFCQQRQMPDGQCSVSGWSLSLSVSLYLHFLSFLPKNKAYGRLSFPFVTQITENWGAKSVPEHGSRGTPRPLPVPELGVCGEKWQQGPLPHRRLLQRH